MRCVLTAESSLRTFVLTLAAASRNGKRENPDLGRAVADEDYARSMHEGGPRLYPLLDSIAPRWADGP
jgi:hypothetical protein